MLSHTYQRRDIISEKKYVFLSILNQYNNNIIIYTKHRKKFIKIRKDRSITQKCSEFKQHFSNYPKKRFLSLRIST